MSLVEVDEKFEELGQAHDQRRPEHKFRHRAVMATQLNEWDRRGAGKPSVKIERSRNEAGRNGTIVKSPHIYKLHIIERTKL